MQFESESVKSNMFMDYRLFSYEKIYIESHNFSHYKVLCPKAYSKGKVDG